MKKPLLSEMIQNRIDRNKKEMEATGIHDLMHLMAAIENECLAEILREYARAMVYYKGGIDWTKKPITDDEARKL